MIKLNLIPKAYAAIEQGSDISGPGSFQQGVTVTGEGATLDIFISRIVGTLTVVAGLAFLIYFLMGGIGWITAGGDQQKHEHAKKQLTDALIGLIIVVVSYFVVGIVGTVLGLDLLNPSSIIESFAQ